MENDEFNGILKGGLTRIGDTLYEPFTHKPVPTYMTLEKQEAHFKSFTKKQSEIMLKKGSDYATEYDVLSNFKLAGGICGLSPEKNCLSLIATKVARLGVLLAKDGEPENEAIRDSVLDLANYAFLLDCLLSEKIANEL